MTLKHKCRLRNDIQLGSFIFNFTFYLATILRHLPSASLSWGFTKPRIRFVDLTLGLRCIVNHITPLIGVCLYSHLSNISFSLSRAHITRILSHRYSPLESELNTDESQISTPDWVNCSLPLIAWLENEYQEYNLSSKISWWEFEVMYIFLAQCGFLGMLHTNTINRNSNKNNSNDEPANKPILFHFFRGLNIGDNRKSHEEK